MARLEARLSVRLLNRSTRQMQLTAEGSVFYERSVRVLADMRSLNGSPLMDCGKLVTVPAVGNTQVSDGAALQRLAVAGLGLARLALFHARDDLAAGRLVPVLEAFNPGDLEEIHAVFLGHGGWVPARVRALLDFLVENVKIE